jgi:hypothetical protein
MRKSFARNKISFSPMNVLRAARSSGNLGVELAASSIADYLTDLPLAWRQQLKFFTCPRFVAVFRRRVQV